MNSATDLPVLGQKGSSLTLQAMMSLTLSQMLKEQPRLDKGGSNLPLLLNRVGSNRKEEDSESEDEEEIKTSATKS